MKFYHGSTIKGLTELRPHLPVGAHIQEPLVYLTTSKQLALPLYLGYRTAWGKDAHGGYPQRWNPCVSRNVPQRFGVFL